MESAGVPRRSTAPGTYVSSERASRARGFARGGLPAALAVLGSFFLLSWEWNRRVLSLARGPYLQSVTDQSATIVCRTDAPGVVTLRYGRIAGPPWEDVMSSPLGDEHVFVLTGLLPETRYTYELKSEGAVLAGGESCTFRTAPPLMSRAPFRFLAWGDSGLGTTRQLDVAARMLDVLPAPHFALLLGDIVYPDGDAQDYGPKFFAPYTQIMPRMPMWPTLGNHDVDTQNGAAYLDAFYLPTTGGAPGHPSNTERYYSFDHGMAHFVSVDGESSSSSPGSAMYQWLEDDLAGARSRGKRWLIVFVHRPPYSKGTHDSDTEGQMIALREDLVPLYESQGVDLVAAGHSHNYERSYLVRSDAVLQGDPSDYTKIGTPNGTLYLVSGCGGQSGSGDLDHPVMARSLGDVAGFSVIDVSWEELRGSFVDRNGETQDIFSLRKANDAKPPRIAELEASAIDEIKLVFDEPVVGGIGTGAGDPANYAILPARAVLSATLGSDQRTVVLQTATLLANRAYQLAVSSVTDASGNQVIASDTKGWFVFADALTGPPQAVATTAFHAANAPASFLFSGARSTDPGGSLASLRWDFGDGSALVTGGQVTHQYDRTGLFTASLIATDGAGLESVARMPIRIHAQGLAPIAGLSANVLLIDAGGTVAFASAGSRDPDGGNVSVSWDFGDPASGQDNYSRLAAPTHAYAAPGVYPVVLTVIDDEGSGATDTALVFVQDSGSTGERFVAVEDARVSSGNASSNFGSETTLRLRAPSPESRSFLRFQVSGIAGSVISAKLRLSVGNSSDDAGTLYRVTGAWSEDTITWNNAPSITGSPLDSGGEAEAGTWVEYDVTSAVGGDGSYSFALTSASTDTVIFFSREGSSPPELVITSSGPGPDTTAPQVTSRNPAPGATSVARSTNVTASFDEPVQGVSGSSFKLRQGTTSVAAQVSYDGATRTATLNPSADLAPDTTYTVDLTSAIRDLAPQPNALAPLSWSFTTQEEAPSSTVTVTAVADARVSSNPGNYGTETTLRLRAGSPEFRSYVRFQVSGITGSVSSARLRLFVTEASDDAGTVYGVSSAWTETAITWSNAPPITGSPLASAGAASVGTWKEYDVTSAVSGDGSHSFALTSASSDTVSFSSREGANPPQLVITSGGPPVDVTAPQVTGRSPGPGATSVARTTNVTTTFDEPVQGVSGSTFTLKQGATSIAAAVSYDAATRTATLNPSADLASDTTYTVDLTGGIRDLAPQANALVPLSWTFTTEEAQDTTAPQVTGRSPAPGATSVARTTNVTATFDEPVQGVSSSSFTLKLGATSVAAAVSYDGATRTAVLNPSADLAPATTYTVNLTSAIRDLATQPNALAPLTWTFTTVDDPAAPVTLTAVADARVTESSPTANNGSETTLRVRAPAPESRSYLRFQVSGITGGVTSARLRLFVTDASDDTGSVYAVSTAWNEGTITWNNAPPITGSLLDSGGAAGNGTWVEYDVSSAVTGDGSYGFALTSASTDTATFSSREGANAPQLVVSGGGAPADTTAPQVTSQGPAPGSTAVPRTANVIATFDEPVQGVSGSSFTLKQGATSVPAAVSYDGATRTATLNPSADLAPDTTYTVNLTSSIHDLAPQPNALVPLSWTFSTEDVQTAPLTLTAVADARTSSSSGGNYGSETTIRLRAGSPEFRSYVRFQLSGITGTVTSARLRLFVTEASNDAGTVYGVSSAWTESTITWSNAPPIAGSPLDSGGAASNGTWVEYDVTSAVTGDGSHSFVLTSASTDTVAFSSREGANPPQLVVTGGGPPADTTAPQVTGRNPAPGATSVARTTNVTAIFDEPVQGVSGSTFTLKQGATSVAAAVSYDAATRTAVLNPSADLAHETTYTVDLTGGIRDLATQPNALVPLSWSFTTVQADTTAPQVTSRSPAPGATSVPRTANVTATFDEPVQGVSGASFTLQQGATSVAATVSYDGATRTATLNPSADLDPETTYTVDLTSAIRDLATQPNALAPLGWSFTTEQAPSSTVTVTAVADARTNSTSGGNYGAETTIRLRAGNPEFRSYVRFQVSGLTGGVSSARLRLFVTEASNDAGTVYAVSSAWTESTINWTNAPPITGSPLASGGAASVGTWKEYDVTSAVSGDGPYSFALTSASTDTAIFSSREGTNPPQLVITTGGGAPADTTPPQVVNRSPAPGATSVVRTTNVTATFDELVQGVNGSTFTLKQGATSIAAAVSYDAAARTATLNPSADLAPETTYTVDLTSGIRDLAVQPNPLVPLSWTFTTETAPISSLTLTAAADAYVSSTSPGNYGSETVLRMRAGSPPELRSYVRFDVGGLSGSVISARLRLFVTDASSDAGSVYAVGGVWTEGGITWSNAPPIAGNPLASGGSASNGTWKEYDVTSAFSGDGSYTFALTSASTDSAVFSSREGANPPQLVLQFFASTLAPPGVGASWPQNAGSPVR